MKRVRLPGLSVEQQQQLFHALVSRSALDGDTRNEYPAPDFVSDTFFGHSWWALLKELYDRPLLTVLGLVATCTYPLFWLKHLLNRWI